MYTGNRRRLHVRYSNQFYFARRQQRRKLTSGGPSIIPRLEQIVNVDNLLLAWEKLRAEGGPAPGVDGIRPGDLSRREAAQILREVSELILDGDYIPQPTRAVRRPKSNGRGYRTLRIGTVPDRILAMALDQALRDFWETIFLPRSFGFRPKLSPEHLLAALESTMRREERWVLAIDDVRNAFDNILIDELMEDHRRYLEEPELVEFIDTVLRGSAGRLRERGIDQGSSYSPTCLNVRLHHVHDLDLERDHIPWFRYADNLVYACKSVSEGEQLIAQVIAMLAPCGLTLKGETPPQDLRQGRVELLGFGIRELEGELHFEITDTAWSDLERQLLEAHESQDPPGKAQSIIQGWIAALGPAIDCSRLPYVHSRLRTLLTRAALPISFLDDIGAPAERAHQRWQSLRECARISSTAPVSINPVGGAGSAPTQPSSVA